MSVQKKRILALGNVEYFQTTQFELHCTELNFNPNSEENNQIEVLEQFLTWATPFDAICIALDSPSQIMPFKDFYPQFHNLHEKPVILLANDLRMDRSLYTWALKQGIAAVFAKDIATFEELESRIVAVIEAFIPPSMRSTAPLLFPYANQELETQIQQFLVLMANHGVCSYAIQGEPGTGKHHLITHLASINKKVSIKYVNCDREIDIESPSPDTILVVSGIELSVPYTQKQVLSLLAQAHKVVYLINHDFEKIAANSLIIPALIEHINVASRIVLPPLRDQLDRLEACIEVLLEDETVCPRHLSNYSCQSAQQVFGQEILDLFRQYPWPSNFNELREIVQTALTQAEIIYQSERVPLSQELLNTRIVLWPSVHSNKTFSFRELHAKQFLDQLDIALIHPEQKSSLNTVLEGHSEALIRHKLRQFHDEFSDVLVKRAYPGIFHFFKIALMICYDMNSKEISNQFQKHIKLLEERYPLEISNNQPGGGDDISQTIHERLSKSSIICLLICVDFMYGIEDEKTHKQIFDYLQNLRKPHQQVFSPIAKECSLDGYRSLLGEIIRPNGKAINLHDDLDRVLTSICDTSIRNALDQLKFMPSSF